MMRKTLIILFITSLIFSNCYAQTDTIFANNEKISCSVKEVTPDAIKFVYPNEEIINSIYKNTVQKIQFKSGRVQTFAEATSYKKVSGADDFDNVTLTSVESEIKGLFKLGDVSSKAKGTTTFASMEKVKERAYRKMKIVAAMMGANLVYLTQNETKGNEMGSKYQSGNSTETNLAGVAYSNKLPNYAEFKKLTEGKTSYQCFEMTKMSQRDADMEKSEFKKPCQIFKVYDESGLIMLNANIDGVKNEVFRVIQFTNDAFTIVYKDGERIYNYKIKTN